MSLVDESLTFVHESKGPLERSGPSSLGLTSNQVMASTLLMRIFDCPVTGGPAVAWS